MNTNSSGFPEWASLPSEIRTKILNTIADQKNPRWSSLASVSQEWHSIVGARNMAKLKIGQSCVDEFGRVVVLQRNLVKHIYLKVDLLEYTRHSPVKPHTDIVGRTMKKVLDILSTWETTGPLTLEINAVAARDSQHWFKNFRWDDDYDAYDRNSPVYDPQEGIIGTWHDSRHGWENGVQVKPPPFKAWQRISQPIESTYIKFPPINAVTCLMIRRQMRRFFFPDELKRILISFKRLSEFVFESWPEAYSDLGSQGHCYHSISDQRDSHAEWTTHTVTQNGFKELAVSFLFDVSDFLKHLGNIWGSADLQSMALTSVLLRAGEQRQDEVQRLLIDTAKMALLMPDLKTFVLWTGDMDISCAFIYTRGERYTEINWRGTWELNIGSDAMNAWNNVAKFHGVQLRTTAHKRITEVIMSHGDAIHHLDLPCEVIQPTSLWQIRMENQRRNPPIRS
ncbi:hypothetical protein HYE68_007453 [Fusarium pseudograminearum]|nr:hypothetical protein HYE68_007453 [Fusarium pseudograminearum]